LSAIVPSTILSYSIVADSAEATGLKWQAASSGGMTLISTTTASSSASINLTSIPGTYRDLKLIVRQLRPASGSAELELRINNNSSTLYFASGHPESNGIFNWGDTACLIAASIDNVASTALSIIDIPDYTNSSTDKIIKSYSVYPTSGYDGTEYRITNYFGSTTTITELNLFMQSGGVPMNITSGTVELYGVK
jgi:hypothetical protein